MENPPVDKNKDGVPLPAKLYVSEAAKSAKKTEQERVVPDPQDNLLDELLAQAKQNTEQKLKGKAL